ncbi:cell wall metabolism sensor histidine kinase WalK [Synechococcus sp. PCC 7336]|uniref:sensor histidine kinase n=1 Tax=Synechococcus sp. PCC 7336 TaxID=195250 RepID=UPI00034AA244|nr:HAMP domain-containing sensor histidine kinase [Synechococcus sp. PCC 7336]
MFQATRRRLALWYAACTAILLLLFASCFYVYVRNTLIERVDDTLHHVVEVVERSLVIEPTGFASPAIEPTSLAGSRPEFRVDLDASLRDRDVAVEDDRIDLEWFSPKGEPLRSTFPAGLHLPGLSKQPEQTVTVAANYTLRQLTQPLRYNDELLGYLRVSHPWFEVTKPTRQLVFDLAVGVTGTLGVVGIVGWFLSGLAIAPVRESYQQLKRFTADASHELRSPIASIQTNVQVALSDPALEAGDRHNWQVVERLTQRLGRLVDDLLFLARQDGGVAATPQCCALDMLVLEAVEEQRSRAAEQGIRLTLAIGDPPDGEGAAIPLYSLMGNEDELVRLLTNLIENALRYTPRGGRVAVDLRQWVKSGQPSIQLQVKDTGIGIPSDAIPHLFDRFYRIDLARSRSASGNSERTRSSSAGSGLGLAIVKTIVDRYRGQIRVESVEGEGSCFTVFLPVKNAESCESAELA